MLRSTVALSLVAVVLAQGGDPFAGLGCNCSAFCAGTCSATRSGRPDKTQNMTLYRMTPLNVDTATDKNTGDGQGDTSYVISRRTAAYDCKINPEGWHCSTLVVKGDDPDSTDLVISFEMEVDGDVSCLYYRSSNSGIPHCSSFLCICSCLVLLLGWQWPRWCWT